MLQDTNMIELNEYLAKVLVSYKKPAGLFANDLAKTFKIVVLVLVPVIIALLLFICILLPNLIFIYSTVWFLRAL